MNRYDKKYKQTQLRILKDLENIYGNLVDDLVVSASLVGISDKEYFLFKNHPVLKKKADDLINKINVRLFLYVNSRTSDVWGLSNSKNDALADEVFAKRDKISPVRLKSHNGESLKTFKEGKIKGLTLSDRVWNSNVNLRAELESSLNAAISKGQSAKSLAKDIKKYLNEPDMRFRRVRDKFGNLAPSKNALQYNPGQGVYRSSQANALRLAKETINRAYRESDHLRWQQTPFIIGYKLRNSERKATICDICKRMNGTIFPKSYKFIGLHVGCLCTAIPIMCSDEEFDRILEDDSYVPKQPEMPVIES